MLLSDSTCRLTLPETVAPTMGSSHAPPFHMGRSLAAQVRIEPAGVRDWPCLCRLVARNFPLENEADLGSSLCHERPSFQVARVGDDVVGFLHAQPRPETGTLWVKMLAVDGRHRGQGLAHRLVEHLESLGRDGQCQRIGMQCLTSNAAMRSLLAQHGYEDLGESITEQGLRVTIYRKALPAREALRSSPRTTVPASAPDSAWQRLLYRLYYLAWFRIRAPLPH